MQKSKLSKNQSAKKSEPETPDFRTKVLDVVARIPDGMVLTYKQVAEAAGSPNAARAVGTIMSHNRDPEIPCHRVVRSDGIIGGYAFGGAEKRFLLEAEQRGEKTFARRQKLFKGRA